MTLDEAHKAMKQVRESLLVADPHDERAYENSHRRPHEPQAPSPKSVR